MNLKRFPALASDDLESKIPPGFPPTFLYSLSWEDPREDDKVLDINPSDTVLTLTSGGCNALDLVLQVCHPAPHWTARSGHCVKDSGGVHGGLSQSVAPGLLVPQSPCGCGAWFRSGCSFCACR